jgi:hypothetical protein
MLTDFQRLFDVLKIYLKTKTKLIIRRKYKNPQKVLQYGPFFGDFNSYDIFMHPFENGVIGYT